MKSVMDARQAQQTYDKGAIGVNNDQIDNYKKAMGFMTQQFASLNPNDPDFNSKMLTIGADAVKLGHLDPNMVVSTMQQIPQDPSQRQMWFKQKLNAMQDATAQLNNLKPQVGSVATGGGTTFTNTDALTGQVTPTTTIQNTITPDAAAQLVDVTNADGSHSKVPMAQVLQKTGMGGVLPPQGQPQGGTGDGGNGRYPGGGSFQTAPAAGIVDANQKANAAGGDMLVADQQSNAQSGTRINMLQNASTALANAQTGTGADKLNAVRGVIATLGGPADKVASYDEANKYLTQYAQTKAASFGHGTDSQLAAALAGNGNTKISNLAAQDVVKVNLGLERMEQARMKAWESAGLQPSQYGQWKSQWGSQVDPRVFVADQMDPSKVQGMVKGMNPKEQATFRTQYNWAVQNGFINGPQ